MSFENFIKYLRLNFTIFLLKTYTLVECTKNLNSIFLNYLNYKNI